MGSRIRSLVHAPKPEIEVKLNHNNKTFTNGDKIDGTISVTAPVDTYFTQLDIEFLGTSRCYVERLTTAAAVSGRSEAFHQFLKLEQPNTHLYYPEDCKLKAGKTYDFPFVFVIPQQLLPKICRHKVSNPEVHNRHIGLPPTLGDKDLTNHPDALDDFTPDMATIRYGVFARLSTSKLINDEVKGSVLAARARRVRIIPAVEEQPPLAVDDSDEYVMRKEKKIKKGVLKGKLGTLAIEAAQPKSLRLPNPHAVCEGRISTMARVMLRFDPLDDTCPPPRLGSLSSKLKITTFFASTARQKIPSKQTALVDLSQGIHSESIQLSSRCMANVEWTKREAGSEILSSRRDSSMSTSSLDFGETPAPTGAYQGKSYYVAKILVPVALPTDKSFVPSFHSCLVSRVYSIGLNLSVQTAGLGGSMDLKVPVQVSSEGSGNTPEGTRRASTVSGVGSHLQMEMDGDDADDIFRPRQMSTGIEAGRSGMSGRREAPPMYSALPPGTRSQALVH
ncbi:hypothetical protein K431DRAFT_230298 [Polychaeton citri CBS 116435]|uniref:Arrestin-like N-terminal domain-containing protein n=1 Tax=Polychaeton citri CBS 116435 TaxID=1314669 RepID=A0A9P4Q644_9PEZI|nr:hypothetical protein K431DRAFT_230298 [Polychaeton citri CBS 116435]